MNNPKALLFQFSPSAILTFDGHQKKKYAQPNDSVIQFQEKKLYPQGGSTHGVA